MTDQNHSLKAVRVVAPPNIALIKYWGKADVQRNHPAVGSLSVTLDGLHTETHLSASSSDQFILNGKPAPAMAARAFAFADAMYAACGEGPRPSMAIQTDNNFPTAAGLASSASGFAALTLALDAAFGWSLGADDLAQWACRGSGSAPRSLLGGFVRLDLAQDAERIALSPVASAQDWPLHLVVAVTSLAQKKTGSTEGMTRSRGTSPYYDQWLATHAADLDAAQHAIAARDFAALAEVTEHSCLKMHAVMFASRPPLIYWNAASVAAIDAVRQMQAEGLQACFTMDAGPQVKVLCTAECADTVADRLARVTGVDTVLRARVGVGARVLDVAVSG
ncbi:MAG: diphosphomevalonate decarboxylase [Pseudomonadota bacterium]